MYKQIQQIHSAFLPPTDKLAPLNKYQVCFSYSKSKNTQAKIMPIIEAVKKHHSESYNHQRFRLTDRGFNKSMERSSSTSKNRTFYKTKMEIQKQKQIEENYQMQESFKYVGNRFPLRKKRSGQQQLLKLLLKFSDNFKAKYKNNQISENNKTPLYDDNMEATNKIIPKLKTRTRFNWTKDRYAINRSKQGRNPENNFKNENLIVNKAPSEQLTMRSCLDKY